MPENANLWLDLNKNLTRSISRYQNTETSTNFGKQPRNNKKHTTTKSMARIEERL
jgi:hypothetical protein